MLKATTTLFSLENFIVSGHAIQPVAYIFIVIVPSVGREERGVKRDEKRI